MASGTKTRQGRSAKSVTGSKGGGRTSKRSGGGGKPGTMGTTGGMKRARASGKRELIDTGTDKRYVRRGAGGQFKESDDVGRSLAADRRRAAKNQSPPGQGDRGDRKR
jgi:hypothetical protein